MIRFGLIYASLWVAMLVGSCYAHATVAYECEKLGAFYVGERVFKCALPETDR